MDPRKLIEKYYTSLPETRDLQLAHAEAVTRKAIELAGSVPDLKPDRQFIEEAAFLHDIGIFMTNSPLLGCTGPHPYIVHGHLGRLLIEDEGLPRHALVCERHVGVGLTAGDIARNGWPMPAVDMLPVSIEEKIVAFADKFFSKNHDPYKEKPLEQVRTSIARWGKDKLSVFDRWAEMFGVSLPAK